MQDFFWLQPSDAKFHTLHNPVCFQVCVWILWDPSEGSLPPFEQFSSKHHLNFLVTENKSYIMQVENVVLFPHSQILAPPKPSWEAETQFRIWIFREL